MKNEIVHVSCDCKYLSDFLDFLPSHKLINKGVTGCGGTTLELKAKRNSLLLFPTIALVLSKSSDDYFSVYGRVSISDIQAYVRKRLENNLPIKIIGTYDSLTKIMEAVPGCVNWFLLIDEYHLLFNDYSFRSSAICGILQNYTKFKDWAFLTATPLDEDCILNELKEVDRITYIWDNSVNVNISIHDTAYILRETIRIIDAYPERNMHIFLNSISTIRNVIKKLKTEDFRVVCSSSQKNKIKHSLPITSDVKKINFYTSCAFEGCDIYDPDGMCVILSDTAIATTILDISTKIRQICGRLRDSKYKDECILVLNTRVHRYAGISPSAFAEKISIIEHKGHSREGLIKRLTDLEIATEVDLYNQNKTAYNNMYINYHDNRFFFDENLKKIDCYNYKLLAEIYKTTIFVITEYKRVGYETQSELVSMRNARGLEWIKEIVKQKENWTYNELEEVFKPLFRKHFLEWNKNNSITLFFPPFEKKRISVDNKKYVVYRFNM